MREELFARIKEYLRENMGIYILISIIFVVGVLSGALSVRFMDIEVIDELNTHFSFFAQDFKSSDGVEYGLIFRESFWQNFRQILFIGMGGVFVFGFPFIALIIGLRGFIIGFTVGFLIENAALGGLIFSLAAVVPHNLIIIPAFIVIGVTAFSYSFIKFRVNYIEKQKRSYSIGEYVFPYLKMMIALSFIVIMGSFVEAYVSMLFMRVSVPVLF